MNAFTFQYVSINTYFRTKIVLFCVYLHSNMFLLIHGFVDKYCGIYA